MAASFRTTGPACCCCNNVYTFVAGDDRLWVNGIVGSLPGKAADFYAPLGQSPYWGADFDPVHKLVFAIRRNSGTLNSIASYDDLLATETVLDTVGGTDTIRHITTDSDNERLFYVRWNPPAATVDRDLWTINHDGTGHASVGAISNADVTFANHQLHYCRANQKIYYIAADAGGLGEVYRIDADGANDTLLHSPIAANRTIFDCAVDNENQVLWWIDRHAAVAGQTTNIYKSDLDGAGVTLVYSAPAVATGVLPNISAVAWSHKLNRLFFWQYDQAISASLDTDNGFSSIDSDGGTFRLEVARGDGSSDWWGIGTNLNIGLRLGCGYETTGASSTA